MKNEIRPLTGLRGIAALWVVVHHSLKLAPDLSQMERLPLSLLGKAGYLGGRSARHGLRILRSR